MKKFSAILLAVIMMLSMVAMAATTANVSDATGTITVDNAVAEQEYNAYRILNLELNDNGAYLYVANEKWIDFVKENFTVDEETGYVTAGNEDDGKTLAAAAIAYAKENNIEADGTRTCAADANSVVFSEMKVGYYLIDSSLGALCVLDTYTDSVTIQDKNDTEVPTLIKVMTGEESAESTSIEIGDDVSFSITVGAKKGAKDYVVHDEMSAGLKLKADTVVVKVGETALTANDDYTLVTSLEDGCTFEIQFAQDYLDTIEEDTNIVITYDATVLKTAGTESNEAHLTYGDKDTPTTPDDTKIYTSKIVINKYDGAVADMSKKLADAKFVLKNGTDENAKFYKYDETTDTVSWVAANEEPTEVTTDVNGAATFLGLKDGTYYLVETDAPDGYNLLAGVTTVVVSAKREGNVVSYTADVANNTGTELPETGGMGTTLFYVVGSLMMAAAVIVLVAKKKVAAK